MSVILGAFAGIEAARIEKLGAALMFSMVVTNLVCALDPNIWNVRWHSIFGSFESRPIADS